MRNQTTILNWRNFLAPLVLHPAMCLYPASNEEATAQREKLAEKAYESATRPLPRILDRLHKFEWSGGDANQGNNDIGNFNGQAHEQTILALLNFKDPTSSTYSKDSIALPTLPVEEDLGIDATFIRYEGETPVAYYVQAKRPDFTKPFLWQLRRKRYPYQAIVTSVDVGNNLRATESSEVGARWETTQALALDLGGRATPADQARVKRYASQVQQLVRQTAQPFEIKP